MTNQQIGITPRFARILMSEEAIYGLILVSGMVVVSGLSVGTSVNALVTVLVTVIVFYLAHVYAGTLGRLAATDGRATLHASLAASASSQAGCCSHPFRPCSCFCSEPSASLRKMSPSGPRSSSIRCCSADWAGRGRALEHELAPSHRRCCHHCRVRRRAHPAEGIHQPLTRQHRMGARPAAWSGRATHYEVTTPGASRRCTFPVRSRAGSRKPRTR